MRETFSRIYQKGVNALWVAFILLLPLTSSPQVAALAGGTMVAAPSGLIAVLLLLIWLLPLILRNMPFQRHLLPLLLFIASVFLSTIIGMWREIPPFKGINPLRENIESILTVFLGVSFYLAAYFWLREKNSKKDFKLVLRLITYGGIATIVKALAEVVIWRVYGTWPDWYRSAHNLIVSGTLFRDRVVAFTFEPSWLADQLNLLFLPYWLASALTRFSAFKRRLWKFQVEDICLVLGAAVLFFTLSRLGYISFLLMIGVLILRGTGWLTRRVQEWLTERNARFKGEQAGKSLRAGLLAVVGLFYIGMFIAAAFVFSRLDHRSREIFNFTNFNMMKYAERLSFGARITYWWGGWNIFNDHPMLGVGLGNAGFYLPEALPAYAWRLIEIRELMFHTNYALNLKSLWVRLLAETGIVGFAAFLSFVLMILFMALSLKRREKRFAKFTGWMGLFGMAAFLVEQFSLDTFALPYFWVTFAFIAAVYEYYRRKKHTEEQV